MRAFETCEGGLLSWVGLLFFFCVYLCYDLVCIVIREFGWMCYATTRKYCSSIEGYSMTMMAFCDLVTEGKK